MLRAVAATLARLVEMKGSGTLQSGGDAFERWPRASRWSSSPSARPATGNRFLGRAESVPGILTMTVLMMTVIYGGVFLTLEKSEGTLRRQLAGPVGRAHVFAGKLLGRMAIAGLQIVLLLVVGRFLYGVSFGSSPVGLALLLLAYAFCVAGLATLLGAVLKTRSRPRRWAGSLPW